MICPYIRKKEKHVQCWTQRPDESGVIVNGVTTDYWDFEQAECPQEECGAWHDGRCQYQKNEKTQL